MKTLLTSALISVSLLVSSAIPAKAYMEIIRHDGECKGGWVVIYDAEGRPAYYICSDVL